MKAQFRTLRSWLGVIPVNGWILALGLLAILLTLVLGSGRMWFSDRSDIHNADAMQGFIGTLAEVLSGVLGFTISVVAIVVQLSADRFTPKVTELFLRERTNFLVIFFLIITTLVAVWTTLAFSIVSEPLLLVILNLTLGTLAFVILIPYFNFVFNFLQPASIIRKIEQQIRQAVISSFSSTVVDTEIIPAHEQCLSALDEIRGIAISAIRQRESLIMLNALDSLKGFALFYSTCKSKLPPLWFLLTKPIASDPDFASVDIQKLQEIEAAQIWLELKILRQYQSIFTDSLNQLREACYIIGINTREIGEKALYANKLEVAQLAIKFFNTYLRAVINTHDIRTGYNILKQYRSMAEAAVITHHDSIALEIANYFRYYSLLAYKANLFFLSETFAFDLGLLAQICCQNCSSVSLEILSVFLKIDQDPESEQQEYTLRGIRKSQAKLAAYYLKVENYNSAHLIYEDMKEEPLSRLHMIHEELRTTREDFWEFTDRGENFYFVEPELLTYVDQFFSWFDNPSLIPLPS